MLIADSQVHLWSRQAEDPPARGRPLQADDLVTEMDDAGVDVCVLVPRVHDLLGNQRLIDTCQRHPTRFRGMACVVPDGCVSGSSLAGLLAQPGILGLRLTFFGESGPLLASAATDWLWQGAEELAVPLMVYAPGRAADLARVARRWPGLRFAIDHLNIPIDARDDDIDAAIATTLDLASHPNVSVKLSGLPFHVTERHPFPSLHPRIKAAVDAFGPERSFWGSDLTRLDCSYRDAVSLFLDELEFLNGPDLELVMGAALLAWLT